MARIIPALLTSDAATFKSRLKQVENLVPLVQIDVTDGHFVPYKNFADPEEIGKMATSAGYEIHLMVKNPEKAVASWLRLPQVKRLAFHIEAAAVPRRIIETVKKAGRLAGVALNPPTPIAKIAPLIPLVDFVLILGVTPGRSGQSFQKSVLKKIRALRRLAPELEIEVDGGMNFETIQAALSAGASSFAVANAVWGAGAPQENLKQLQLL